MGTFKDGIFKYNPLFSLCLGLCSSLAVSTNVESALIMGISVTFVLLLSNLIISLIKKFVSNTIKIPAFILIIASLVTILELILKSYVPLVYTSLGIYLPLITVNCIVLGRAISFASKENTSKSILDALGSGLGFTLAIVLIAMFREILGSNSLTLINNLSSLTNFKLIITNIIPGNILPLKIFATPAGAFLALGIILIIVNTLRRRKIK